jgi:hypothetical protein
VLVPQTTARNGSGGVVDARTPGVTRTPGTVKKKSRGSGGGGERRTDRERFHVRKIKPVV